MMAPRITGLGTWVLVLGLALGWTAQVQGGQQDAQRISPTKKNTPAEAPILDESHAQEAHRLIEQWIVRGAVPAPGQTQSIWVTDLTAVRITLRWMGKRLAIADAYVSNPAIVSASAGSSDRRSAPVVDLTALVRHATQQAIMQVEQSLKDAAQRSTLDTPTAQPRSPMTLARLAPQMLVDLQLARSLEPIVLAAAAPREAVLHQFAPGYHGLKLSLANASGPESAAFIWPATALAANITPASQITQLQAQLQLPINQVDHISRPSLAKANQPVPMLYRFPILHLVRYEPNEPIAQLVRGHVLLSTAPVDGRVLQTLASQLTGHLLAITPDHGRIPGTYQPTSDEFDPPQAPPAEAALAAYALSQQLQFLTRNNPNHPQLAELKNGLGRITDALAKQQISTLSNQADPIAVSLTAMTLIQMPNLGSQRAARDTLIKHLVSLRQPDGSFVTASSSSKNTPAPVNLPTQSLLTAAMVEVYDLTRHPADLSAAQKALDYTWDKTPVNQLPGVMPWLATAHFRLQQLAPAMTPAAKEVAQARMDVLLTLGKALRAKQVAQAPKFGPADVVGGIDLGQLTIDSPPAPDWRTARFLCFLAQMLPQPAVRQSSDKIRWILDAGLAARFIAQLTYDEPSAYYVPFNRDLVGGVRISLQDNRVGVVSSAMSLLAVTQLQQSLLELSKP